MIIHRSIHFFVDFLALDLALDFLAMGLVLVAFALGVLGLAVFGAAFLGVAFLGVAAFLVTFGLTAALTTFLAAGVGATTATGATAHAADGC